ncbi:MULTISPECIES: hypothetical protein [unclassified Sphingomonas]|jgi:hypothetical protein|uniref:hypothetical protein n=1 Tax=unclassified Sphingomonas TaxID=196159 RepID=UPI0002DD7698|nr:MULTISPECIES: hypothetical protein [unclassified Sphingomonas]KTF67873.1 hypothetical protein ATB93_16270 [Sphingomonas sp. WG]
MNINDVLLDFDFDLPLRDAFEDRTLSHSRRMLAGVSIGIDLATAYYSVSQLHEALADLEDDHRSGTRFGVGYVEAEDIIKAGSPFQTKVWHLVCDLNLSQAVADLGWLKAVLYSRGSMAKAAAKQVRVTYVTQAQTTEGPTAAALMQADAFS